jgi:hypothetical protein
MWSKTWYYKKNKLFRNSNRLEVYDSKFCSIFHFTRKYMLLIFACNWNRYILDIVMWCLEHLDEKSLYWLKVIVFTFSLLVTLLKILKTYFSKTFEKKWVFFTIFVSLKLVINRQTIKYLYFHSSIREIAIFLYDLSRV